MERRVAPLQPRMRSIGRTWSSRSCGSSMFVTSHTCLMQAKTRLIELCHASREMEPTVLTTEEEGIGILAGAWLGGERGVLLMQSSGVGNCINVLSLAKVCSFPLLMIVSMRGEWGEANPWQVPMGQIAAENLRLAGVIVYEVTEPEAAAPAVEAAARIAFNGSLMVAVLLSQRMLGAKLFKD